MTSESIEAKLAQMKRDAVEAIQVAAAWMELAMIQMVNTPCPAFRSKEPSVPMSEWYFGGKKSRASHTGHSRPGEPPFRETGTGQRSIGVQPLEDGARIGVANIGVDVGSYGNYMASYDAENLRGGRPWFVPLWGERYKPEVDRIISRVLSMKGMVS